MPRTLLAMVKIVFLSLAGLLTFAYSAVGFLALFGLDCYWKPDQRVFSLVATLGVPGLSLSSFFRYDGRHWQCGSSFFAPRGRWL